MLWAVTPVPDLLPQILRLLLPPFPDSELQAALLADTSSGSWMGGLCLSLIFALNIATL